MLERPDGPSYRPDYCCKLIPFGSFFNNTAHSTGLQGIWIFPFYTPTVSGDCSDTRPSVARFVQSTLYSNHIGAEFVHSNNIQFINFTLWDHDHTGFDMKEIAYNENVNTPYKSTFFSQANGTMISGAKIIGNSMGGPANATGITLAWDRGELVKGVSFYNFPDNSSSAMIGTTIDGRCSVGCGGWTTKFESVSFSNVLYRHAFRWDWDNLLYDMDGSLTGGVNNVVVYSDGITKADPRCVNTGQFKHGVVCTNQSNWVRFAFSGMNTDVVFMNSKNNSAVTPSLSMRLTFNMGNMIILETGQTYTMYWTRNGLIDKSSNSSYTGIIYGLLPNDFIIIRNFFKLKPDKVYMGNEVLQPLNSSNNNGDWYWDNSTGLLSYIVINKNTLPFLDVWVNFHTMNCYWLHCIEPVANTNTTSETTPVVLTGRPADALFWSDLATWQKISLVNNGNTTMARAATVPSLPASNDSIVIPKGVYVVLDCKIPDLFILTLEGSLELDNGMDHSVQMAMIFIKGGRLIVGWENDPILTNVQIVLTGQRTQGLQFTLPNGIDEFGGKGIGVYGGLDIHGAPRNVSWTRLNSTASPGTNQITVNDPVDWKAGETILITTTGYVLEQTEICSILSVSPDRKTLTLNTTLAYTHLAFTESFPNGASYTIAAGVALVSRNVKIIGSEYAGIQTDLYGFRILVSNYQDVVNGGLVTYTSFARLSNVEMLNYGQEDLTCKLVENKYGIFFQNLGATQNSSTRSYVRSSSMHHGLGTAIGLAGTSGVVIENNLVHHSLDYGMHIAGSNNIIRKNLVSMTYWGSTFIPSKSICDMTNGGGLDFSAADSAIIEDNLVAGAERVGLFTQGNPCPGQSLGRNLNHSITGNSVYGVDTGYHHRPTSDFGLKCNLVSQLTVFKAFNYAIYYEAVGALTIKDCVLVDNQLGIYPMVITPNPLTHIPDTKPIQISNVIIVGMSDSFDCKWDVKPNNRSYWNNAMSSFSAGPTNGRIGLSWPTYSASSNVCKGNYYTMADYPQITGHLNVVNVTFAHFKTNKCGKQDFCVAANPINMDAQHPITLQNVHIYDVINASKAFIPRPDINTIIPTKCYDMDCDGLKKCLLTDVDGGFLGAPGAIIPQSEYQWGSQKRGLGDFRIPKELLSAPNGSMIDPSQVYSYPGIVRDQNLCQYQPSWQAYQCTGLQYKILVIESLDNDTETRRLSPIAVLSDNGYLDLINGPAEHGWCAPYSCKRRISTFMAMLAADKSYDIYLTGTPPNGLRFRILNADSTFKVRLSMYYYTSMRIDVYKSGTFVAPTNAQTVNGQMIPVDPSSNIDHYMPTYKNVSGTNLLYNQKAYFTMDGSGFYDLVIAPVLVVAFNFPAITPDAFFNSATIAGNMALLLGVPPANIRRVIITRASRRKRQTNAGNSIQLIMATNPVLSSTNSDDLAAAQQSALQLDAKVTNLFVTGQLQQQAQALLNVTISGLTVQKPSANSTAKPLAKVSNIKVITQASGCAAQIPCTTQPLVAIVDENVSILMAIYD